MFQLRRPSPAMVVALVALFSSLTGGAVAATAVPLAKKALFANNAGKLQGKTSAQLVAQAAASPGPASRAAPLVSVKTGSFSLNSSEQKSVSVACAAGEKAISGGYTYDGEALILQVDHGPSSDGASWQLYLMNASSSAGASGTLHAVCLR